MSEDFHGLPVWVWIAGGGLILLALLLARGSSSASTGPTDIGSNIAAVDQAQIAGDVARAQTESATRGSIAQALLAFFAVQDTNRVIASQNAAVLAERQQEADAAYRIALDNNRTAVALGAQSANVAKYQAEQARKASTGGSIFGFLGSAALALGLAL